jgi:2',3'-cyclic-nucleotide 2'-phosphodiesterase (5'-nucleotidase family)
MVGMFMKAVGPKINRVVSVLPAPITREKSPAGETAMGTLIAEAQMQFAKTDFALMNPGGIRQDLTAGGPVTWGTLFGVQPFGNRVIKAKITGAQLKKVLEQQFPADGKKSPTILQVAGMRVTYDMSKPIGSRIVKIVGEDGKPVSMSREYTIAVNNFIKDGGDGFTELKSVKTIADVGDDLAALSSYLKAGEPVPIKPTGRIQVTGEAPADVH